MGEQLRPFADQVGTPAEQVAGFAHPLGVGIGDREVAAAEESSDLAGIDAIVFGFAAVDGFHVQGVAQDERNLVLLAEVRDPVPGEHALGADDEAVAKRLDGTQQGIGPAGQVAVEDGLAGLVEDAQVHGPGVQVNAVVESVLLGVESHRGLLVRGNMRWLCGYFQHTC